MTSFRPEVIADGSGKWAGNQLRFDTYEGAEAWVRDLASRWLAVTDTRVVETLDPPNYRWDANRNCVVEYVPELNDPLAAWNATPPRTDLDDPSLLVAAVAAAKERDA